MKNRNITILIVTIILFLGIIQAFTACGSNEVVTDSVDEAGPKHVKVFYEDGKYGGWPANWGAWSWGNEILVSFTVADHKERSGHTFDVNTAINMFARSTDGGESWELQDAYDSGITGATFEHNLGDKSEPSTTLDEPIYFTHPDFAFTFRAHTLRDGPSSFYFSYDRGQNWEGPFSLTVDFGSRSPAGIVSRTDYIIEGRHEMTAFLTVGFRDGDEDWREVAVVRTTDGGKTWNFLSWIGPERINSIMPSSLRLDESRILTTIRVHDNPRRIVSYLSLDDGETWQQLDDPVPVRNVASGNPPALLKLNDGRLCMVFGIRRADALPDGIGIYAVFSRDEGVSWTDPILVRGKDGANGDIGYPRAVQRPDGEVVAIYYYNNANDETKLPYRSIEATIFDPDIY